MESLHTVKSKPSKLNGENIAGAAFLFFSFLFLAAGQINAVFAVIYPADYFLIAVGAALVFLGYRTWRNEMNMISSDSKVSSY